MARNNRTDSTATKSESSEGSVSFGFTSSYADDEHIVRHSLSSEEGMPVVDVDEIMARAAARRAERKAAGVEDRYRQPFPWTPEVLERDARLAADVEANEEAELEEAETKAEHPKSEKRLSHPS